MKSWRARADMQTLSSLTQTGAFIMNSGLGNVRIKGISGKMYTFRAYPLETLFAEIGAVYCITRRNHTPDGRISHSRIYCGETSNLSTRTDDVQHIVSFKAKKANCICILPKEEESLRMEIERDVHGNYKFLF